MQKFSSDFYDHYRRVGHMELLAHRGSVAALPLFAVRAIIFLGRRRSQYDIVHLYDAVLSPLGAIFRLLCKAKITCTINGLDVVFPLPVYQRVVSHFLPRLDRVFSISRFTSQQARARGVPAAKLIVVPPGIASPLPGPRHELAARETRADSDLTLPQGRMLLTVGRLVARKGHEWFVQHVMPRLPRHYYYVVAGFGRERARIVEAARRADVGTRVVLVGQVTEPQKTALLKAAHLFVMPNIRVEGDQEGFGIAALEAGMHNLPVIASQIEGLPDAIIPGMTGRLVPERNAEKFAAAILHPRIVRRGLAGRVRRRFGWYRVVRAYMREFERLTALDPPAGHND